MKRFLLVFLLLSLQAKAQTFKDRLGDINISSVNESVPWQAPYLTWGADLGLFTANGGLKTSKDSIYGKSGLNIEFVKGDDFKSQVKKYMNGNPFLRGEMTMISMAADVLCEDPRTAPVILFQLSFSAGDHCVAKKNIKTLSDLKGKRGSLQIDGPHIGMLSEILQTAKLKWEDVQIEWAENLTGENSPAQKFRDKNLDFCFVISPDMIGLTGGLDSVGGNAEGNVEGSHVLISTATMSRSIADLYAVRSDFYEKHKAELEKFTAGYLQSCEELMKNKIIWNKNPKHVPYIKSLQMAQNIFGKDVLPTIEVDAAGLVADATFVGLPGQINFFNDPGNMAGFDVKKLSTFDFLMNNGFIRNKRDFAVADFDYQKLASMANIAYKVPTNKPRINAEAVNFDFDSLNDNTLVSFDIQFALNQTSFPANIYGDKFAEVIKQTSVYGNAVALVRGHADPTQTLIDFVKSGMAKGILKQDGNKGNRQYYFNGRPLALEQTSQIIELLNSQKSNFFDGSDPDPRSTLSVAKELSEKRAKAVVEAIIQYAKDNNIKFDSSQIKPVSVGIQEPLIAKPQNKEEASKNMRVEFRLIKVNAEAVIGDGGIDY